MATFDSDTLAKTFVLATCEALQVQCSTTAKPISVIRKQRGSALDSDIAGLIGITAPQVLGSVAICFPQATYLQILGRMLGETFTKIDDETADGAGEIANIVFGIAKRKLNEHGLALEMALPSVIRGQGLQLASSAQTTTTLVQLETDVGPLQLEISVAVK